MKNTDPCCNSRLAVCVHWGKSQEQSVHTSRLALKEAKATEIWGLFIFQGQFAI